MILAVKALLWVVVSFLLIALVLFLSAGTIAWLAGWIDLILLHGWHLVGIWLLLKYNPGLLEERVLLKELPGYDAYMAQVKYRLIPNVW